MRSYVSIALLISTPSSYDTVSMNGRSGFDSINQPRHSPSAQCWDGAARGGWLSLVFARSNCLFWLVLLCVWSAHLISSHRIASHRIASHGIVSHGIVSYRIASYRIVSHRIASHRIVSHRIASYRIVSYRIASYRIVSYRIVSHLTHYRSASESARQSRILVFCWFP